MERPKMYYSETRDNVATFAELVEASGATSEIEFENYCSHYGYYAITKEMGNEFLRDLRGTLRIKPDTCSITVAYVAETMSISPYKAIAFLRTVTERQGMGYVV